MASLTYGRLRSRALGYRIRLFQPAPQIHRLLLSSNPLKNRIRLRQSAFRLDVGDSTRNPLPAGLVISQSFLNSVDTATLLLALDLLR
jgi:hypothetical protein